MLSVTAAELCRCGRWKSRGRQLVDRERERRQDVARARLLGAGEDQRQAGGLLALELLAHALQLMRDLGRRIVHRPDHRVLGRGRLEMLEGELRLVGDQPQHAVGITGDVRALAAARQAEHVARSPGDPLGAASGLAGPGDHVVQLAARLQLRARACRRRGCADSGSGSGAWSPGTRCPGGRSGRAGSPPCRSPGRAPGHARRETGGTAPADT